MPDVPLEQWLVSEQSTSAELGAIGIAWPCGPCVAVSIRPICDSAYSQTCQAIREESQRRAD